MIASERFVERGHLARTCQSLDLNRSANSKDMVITYGTVLITNRALATADSKLPLVSSLAAARRFAEGDETELRLGSRGPGVMGLGDMALSRLDKQANSNGSIGTGLIFVAGR